MRNPREDRGAIAVMGEDRGAIAVMGEDRGAISIMMVLSLVVIFGVAMLVIDAGALFQERRELQNAADAAALSVAIACAEDDCADPTAIGQTYANANMSDGAVNITVTVDHTAQTVAVHTASAAPVEAVFGAAIGVDDSNVVADAVAAWRIIEQYNVIPLVISECELDAGRASMVPGEPGISSEMLIAFHEGSHSNPSPTNADCYGGTHDTDGTTTAPGGFGWLESDVCAALVGPDQWAGAKTGNSPPNGCSSVISVGTVLWLAYFDEIDTSTCAPELGGSKCYHLAGFFGFELSGFRFPGASSNPPCDSPITCIKGHFVQFGPAGPDPNTVVGAENLADPVANIIE